MSTLRTCLYCEFELIWQVFFWGLWRAVLLVCDSLDGRSWGELLESYTGRGVVLGSSSGSGRGAAG